MRAKHHCNTPRLTWRVGGQHQTKRQKLKGMRGWVVIRGNQHQSANYHRQWDGVSVSIFEALSLRRAIVETNKYVWSFLMTGKMLAPQEVFHVNCYGPTLRGDTLNPGRSLYYEKCTRKSSCRKNVYQVELFQLHDISIRCPPPKYIMLIEASKHNAQDTNTT